VKNAPGEICGRENQRPCTLTERIPSCNPGLVENFIHNKCVATADTPRYKLADKKFKELGKFIASKIGFAQQTARNPNVKNALSNNRQALDKVVNRSAVGSRQMPDGYLLRTLTVGASAGAKVIVGGSAGAGAAIDLTGRRPAYLYGTAEYGVSLGIGASAGIDVGFWVCQNNKIGGDSWGIEFSPAEIVQAAKTFADLKQAFKPGLDVGIGLWFDYHDVFQGFTITPSVGAGVDFGGLVKAGTLVDGDPNVNCDGRPVNATVLPRRPELTMPKVFMKTMRFGASTLQHSRIPNSVKPGYARVCLQNMTSTPKSLEYRLRGINPLRVAPNGGQSCATMPANFRLEYTYNDNGRVVKKSGMSMAYYDGQVVHFRWDR